MNSMKAAIIVLVIALAAVIGYTIYVYQGPMKRIGGESQKLLAEIELDVAAPKSRLRKGRIGCLKSA